MVGFGTKKLWFSLCILLLVQALLVFCTVRRESLTFDEGDHMYAAYRMMHDGDYGLNPEHPPLAKLLAALPLVGTNLWQPALTHRFFKDEAYGNGYLWWVHNDGPNHTLTLAMRLSVGMLALCLSVLVFCIVRNWYGDRAALLALVMMVFEPNVLAHSALVTTDIGVTLFFLASIFAFYRWVQKPTWQRLLLVGLAVGLLLATKHSGILVGPMLILLAIWEVLTAERGQRLRLALRMAGAAAVVIVVGVLVLWSFYGFRYAARPAGIPMSVTVESYAAPLSHMNQAIVLTCAHLHLLPESYLIGLVDVKRMAEFYPTYLFGRVYAHGVLRYFPMVILIKTTLGMLALVAAGLFALLSGAHRRTRELVYLLVPGLVYLSIAMLSGMNIGARHILILFVVFSMLSGAGAAALLEGGAKRRLVTVAVGVLIVSHILSSLSVFPNTMAYANEAWGGAKNVHKLLSDSNSDWAQQLISVKAWQDRHPGQECWLAYFANPEIKPEGYGIHCHKLPTTDTYWMGGSDVIAPEVNGYVLLSAGDLSGCEWPDMQMNPYRAFESLQPVEVIDYGVMVYRGSYQLHQAAALSRAIDSYRLQGEGKLQQAMALAREAVQIDPTEVVSQTARGDMAAAMGEKEEARQAWTAAIQNARRLEPDAQLSYIPDLEAKLKKL